MVDDFASIGALNDAAVAGARTDPHDRIACIAGAGFGGLYRLIAGSSDLERAKLGTWLSKPDGMAYSAFREQCSALIDPATMGLWQRQMSLGPGLEFCVLGADFIHAPAAFGPVEIELRQIR